MDRVVEALFPTHPGRVGGEYALTRVEGIPLFMEAELVSTVRSMRNRKAPGPDGVPAETLKVVTTHYPQLLLRMYNECLVIGIFPARWKVARLALISKGKDNSDSPSAYRSRCTLDTTGKVMEKLLKPQLQLPIQTAEDLFDRQHGFRRQRSTISTIP